MNLCQIRFGWVSHDQSFPDMKLTPDAIIATAKLTKYLLVWRPADDKSKFLAQAGYDQDNWQQLKSDLRSQILPLEAVLSHEPNRFGDVYEIQGVLVGCNGIRLAVITIWMIEYETKQTKFVTLYPDKETES
jgi:hypothetical protein